MDLGSRNPSMFSMDDLESDGFFSVSVNIMISIAGKRDLPWTKDRYDIAVFQKDLFSKQILLIRVI